MDTFASVWDAADDVEADQHLASLTAARIQVTPVWSFLAAAQDADEFQHRFALIEDGVREAARVNGVDFAVLAKSLVDDFRVLAATGDGEVKGGKADCSHDWDFRNHCKKCGAQMSFPKKGSKTAAFYVKDGDKEVGGPYDSKSDAQDAIDGGDVSGKNLTVSGGGDNDDDGGDADGDGKDEDAGDDEDDDNTDEDSNSGSDDDPDDDASDDDGKGDNPFAKKKASLDEIFPIFTLAGNDGLKYGTCANCGDTNTKVTSQSTDKGSKWVGTDCSCKKKSALQTEATHSVVHQPGETVFVDHFMGHDEHEGRKGVWAQVVASPGQHPHEDRADSHLLKPMAPGGTHFFHHFGSLERVAHPGLGMGADEEWDDEDDKPTLNRSNFDGDQRRYDYFADHEPHSEDNYGDPYGRSERRVESSLQAQASPACPSCGGATKERGLPSDPKKSGIQCTDSKGVGCGARNTVIPKHKFPSASDGINLAGSYKRCTECPHEKHGATCGGAAGIGKCTCSTPEKKTALADGVDPLALVVSTVPGGEGQAEAEAHHEGATASLVARFASLYNEFATE